MLCQNHLAIRQPSLSTANNNPHSNNSNININGHAQQLIGLQPQLATSSLSTSQSSSASLTDQSPQQGSVSPFQPRPQQSQVLSRQPSQSSYTSVSSTPMLTGLSLLHNAGQNHHIYNNYNNSISHIWSAWLYSVCIFNQPQERLPNNLKMLFSQQPPKQGNFDNADDGDTGYDEGGDDNNDDNDESGTDIEILPLTFDKSHPNNSTLTLIQPDQSSNEGQQDTKSETFDTLKAASNLDTKGDQSNSSLATSGKKDKDKGKKAKGKKDKGEKKKKNNETKAQSNADSGDDEDGDSEDFGTKGGKGKEKKGPQSEKSNRVQQSLDLKDKDPETHHQTNHNDQPKDILGPGEKGGDGGGNEDNFALVELAQSNVDDIPDSEGEKLAVPEKSGKKEKGKKKANKDKKKKRSGGGDDDQDLRLDKPESASLQKSIISSSPTDDMLPPSMNLDLSTTMTQHTDGVHSPTNEKYPIVTLHTLDPPDPSLIVEPLVGPTLSPLEFDPILFVPQDSDGPNLPGVGIGLNFVQNFPRNDQDPPKLGQFFDNFDSFGDHDMAITPTNISQNITNPHDVLQSQRLVHDTLPGDGNGLDKEEDRHSAQIAEPPQQLQPKQSQPSHQDLVPQWFPSRQSIAMHTAIQSHFTSLFFFHLPMPITQDPSNFVVDKSIQNPNRHIAQNDYALNPQNYPVPHSNHNPNLFYTIQQPATDAHGGKSPVPGGKSADQYDTTQPIVINVDHRVSHELWFLTPLTEINTMLQGYGFTDVLGRDDDFLYTMQFSELLSQIETIQAEEEAKINKAAKKKQKKKERKAQEKLEKQQQQQQQQLDPNKGDTLDASKAATPPVEKPSTTSDSATLPPTTNNKKKTILPTKRSHPPTTNNNSPAGNVATNTATAPIPTAQIDNHSSSSSPAIRPAKIDYYGSPITPRELFLGFKVVQMLMIIASWHWANLASFVPVLILIPLYYNLNIAVYPALILIMFTAGFFVGRIALPLLAYIFAWIWFIFPLYCKLLWFDVLSLVKWDDEEGYVLIDDSDSAGESDGSHESFSHSPYHTYQNQSYNGNTKTGQIIASTNNNSVDDFLPLDRSHSYTNNNIFKPTMTNRNNYGTMQNPEVSRPNQNSRRTKTHQTSQQHNGPMVSPNVIPRAFSRGIGARSKEEVSPLLQKAFSPDPNQNNNSNSHSDDNSTSHSFSVSRHAHPLSPRELVLAQLKQDHPIYNPIELYLDKFYTLLLILANCSASLSLFFCTVTTPYWLLIAALWYGAGSNIHPFVRSTITHDIPITKRAFWVSRYNITKIAVLLFTFVVVLILLVSNITVTHQISNTYISFDELVGSDDDNDDDGNDTSDKQARRDIKGDILAQVATVGSAISSGIDGALSIENNARPAGLFTKDELLSDDTLHDRDINNNKTETISSKMTQIRTQIDNKPQTQSPPMQPVPIIRSNSTTPPLSTPEMAITNAAGFLHSNPKTPPAFLKTNDSQADHGTQNESTIIVCEGPPVAIVAKVVPQKQPEPETVQGEEKAKEQDKLQTLVASILPDFDLRRIVRGDDDDNRGNVHGKRRKQNGNQNGSQNGKTKKQSKRNRIATIPVSANTLNEISHQELEDDIVDKSDIVKNYNNYNQNHEGHSKNISQLGPKNQKRNKSDVLGANNDLYSNENPSTWDEFPPNPSQISDPSQVPSLITDGYDDLSNLEDDSDNLANITIDLSIPYISIFFSSMWFVVFWLIVALDYKTPVFNKDWTNDPYLRYAKAKLLSQMQAKTVNIDAASTMTDDTGGKKKGKKNKDKAAQATQDQPPAATHNVPSGLPDSLYPAHTTSNNMSGGAASSAGTLIIHESNPEQNHGNIDQNFHDFLLNHGAISPTTAYQLQLHGLLRPQPLPPPQLPTNPPHNAIASTGFILPSLPPPQVQPTPTPFSPVNQMVIPLIPTPRHPSTTLSIAALTFINTLASVAWAMAIILTPFLLGLFYSYSLFYSLLILGLFTIVTKFFCTFVLPPLLGIQFIEMNSAQPPQQQHNRQHLPSAHPMDHPQQYSNGQQLQQQFGGQFSPIHHNLQTTHEIYNSLSPQNYIYIGNNPYQTYQTKRQPPLPQYPYQTVPNMPHNFSSGQSPHQQNQYQYQSAINNPQSSQQLGQYPLPQPNYHYQQQQLPPPQLQPHQQNQHYAAYNANIKPPLSVPRRIGTVLSRMLTTTNILLILIIAVVACLCTFTFALNNNIFHGQQLLVEQWCSNNHMVSNMTPTHASHAGGSFSTTPDRQFSTGLDQFSQHIDLTSPLITPPLGYVESTRHSKRQKSSKVQSKIGSDGTSGDTIDNGDQYNDYFDYDNDDHLHGHQHTLLLIANTHYHPDMEHLRPKPSPPSHSPTKLSMAPPTELPIPSDTNTNSVPASPDGITLEPPHTRPNTSDWDRIDGKSYQEGHNLDENTTIAVFVNPILRSHHCEPGHIFTSMRLIPLEGQHIGLFLSGLVIILIATTGLVKVTTMLMVQFEHITGLDGAVDDEEDDDNDDDLDNGNGAIDSCDASAEDYCDTYSSSSGSGGDMTYTTFENNPANNPQLKPKFGQIRNTFDTGSTSTGSDFNGYESPLLNSGDHTTLHVGQHNGSGAQRSSISSNFSHSRTKPGAKWRNIDRLLDYLKLQLIPDVLIQQILVNQREQRQNDVKNKRRLARNNPTTTTTAINFTNTVPSSGGSLLGNYMSMGSSPAHPHQPTQPPTSQSFFKTIATTGFHHKHHFFFMSKKNQLSEGHDINTQHASLKPLHRLAQRPQQQTQPKLGSKFNQEPRTTTRATHTSTFKTNCSSISAPPKPKPKLSARVSGYYGIISATQTFLIPIILAIILSALLHHTKIPISHTAPMTSSLETADRYGQDGYSVGDQTRMSWGNAVGNNNNIDPLSSIVMSTMINTLPSIPVTSFVPPNRRSYRTGSLVAPEPKAIDQKIVKINPSPHSTIPPTQTDPNSTTQQHIELQTSVPQTQSIQSEIHSEEHLIEESLAATSHHHSPPGVIQLFPRVQFDSLMTFITISLCIWLVLPLIILLSYRNLDSAPVYSIIPRNNKQSL